MKLVQLGLLGMLVINFLFLGVAYHYYSQNNQNTPIRSKAPVSLEKEIRQSPNEVKPDIGEFAPKLMNVTRAKHLLKLLDVQNFTESALMKGEGGVFKKDNQYCEKQTGYLFEDTNRIFTDENFATDLAKMHSFREDILPNLKREVFFDFSSQDRQKIKEARTLSEKINIFFTIGSLFKYNQVGKHFSCLFQISNQVPGRENMTRKDFVGNALDIYSKNYLNRTECFNSKKFFPKTWVLYQKDQCENFFKEFMSEKYQQLKKEKGLVYFRKAGHAVHQGKGVFPLTDKEEESLLQKYKNGTLCGQENTNNVMQEAITNLLLLNGHKFHFRVYLFIASTNPLIAYYHDGYLRLSVNPYDPISSDFDTFVTNLGITKESAQGGRPNSPFKDLNETEIKEITCWFFPQLQEHLLKEKLITDENWLDNHLRREFKKAMVHLVRMSQDSFVKHSSLTEIYGLDFVMDENFGVWFIEANPFPLIQGWSPRTKEFFTKLLHDDFEISFGLLRSRAKRVIMYLNELIIKKSDQELNTEELENERKRFAEITKNRFEQEFEPTPQNRFEKIIDENIEGVGRYFDLISDNCL